MPSEKHPVLKPPVEMTAEHRAELRAAKHILENPGLAAKITNLVGKPIEKGMALLPAKWSDIIHEATRKSLDTALRAALFTLDKETKAGSKNIWHKLAVTATGAGGGAFGLPALAVELPVSTTIMLRSIADIARSEGENLFVPAARLACIEVFALGGATTSDDAVESGYFAVRAALAKTISEAAQYIAERGLAQEGAPAVVRLIAAISGRLSVQVSEKAAGQAIPAIGAVGGALINLAFIDHFQDMARGHFTVRRLERIYGAGLVRETYLDVQDSPPQPE